MLILDELQSTYEPTFFRAANEALLSIVLYPLRLDMSEADLIYTETLMQRGKENYEGKEIVILGGGDGGLLWELLKENPKHVTMLEVPVKIIYAADTLQERCTDVLTYSSLFLDRRHCDESLQ